LAQSLFILKIFYSYFDHYKNYQIYLDNLFFKKSLTIDIKINIFIINSILFIYLIFNLI